MDQNEKIRVYERGLEAFNSRSNLRGTRNLLLEGLLKLDRFPESHGGLELESLRMAVRGWLTLLEDGEIPEEVTPPQIARRSGKHLFP